MNYLYMTCKDCGREAIKKQIFKKYGVQIDSDSLYDLNFRAEMQKIISDNLDEVKKVVETDTVIKQAYERVMRFCEGENIEQIRMKTTLRELKELLSECFNYESDLAADSLLGLLWADSNNEVSFEQEVQNLEDRLDAVRTRKLEYLWGKCGECTTSKENYPYADMRVFPEEDIPGGCVDFHKVMMNPEHIIIFDVPEVVAPRTNIRKYTFPKMDIIYQKLDGSPIENFLLLERTVGVGTTILLYTKFKDLKTTKALETLQDFIKKCMDIEPIFIRKSIINMLTIHILDTKDDIKASLSVTMDLLDIIVFVVKKMYRSLFEYAWSVYYLRYQDSDIAKEDVLELLRGTAYQSWLRYYEDYDIYCEFLEEYDLYDWRAKRSIKTFFSDIQEKDIGHSTLMEKVSSVNIKCANGKTVSFLAAKPLKGMGEKIRYRAEKELALELVAPLPVDEMTKLLYKKEEKIFKELWQSERLRFYNMTYTYPAYKTTKNTIYAYIQIQILQKIKAPELMK